MVLLPVVCSWSPEAVAGASRADRTPRLSPSFTHGWVSGLRALVRAGALIYVTHNTCHLTWAGIFFAISPQKKQLLFSESVYSFCKFFSMPRHIRLCLSKFNSLFITKRYRSIFVNNICIVNILGTWGKPFSCVVWSKFLHSDNIIGKWTLELLPKYSWLIVIDHPHPPYP